MVKKGRFKKIHNSNAYVQHQEDLLECSFFSFTCLFLNLPCSAIFDILFKGLKVNGEIFRNTSSTWFIGKWMKYALWFLTWSTFDVHPSGLMSFQLCCPLSSCCESLTFFSVFLIFIFVLKWKGVSQKKMLSKLSFQSGSDESSTYNKTKSFFFFY